MAVPRRSNEKQNLIQVPTFITEEGLVDTKYFNVVGLKEELPTGKSSFLIGGSEFLKPNVKLKIEILNSIGEVIYTEPVRGYRENNLRRVSIEIYGDAEPGIATLTLLGEIDSTRVNIPQQWRGVYNVKYIRRFNINTRVLNTEQIIFYKQPIVNVLAVTNAFKEYIPRPRETRILTGQIKNKVSAQGTSHQITDPVTKEESFPSEAEGDKAKPFLSFLNLPTFKLAPIFNFQFPLFSHSPAAGDSILHISSGSIDDGMIGEALSFAPVSSNLDTSANTNLPDTYVIPASYSSSITNRLKDTQLELANVVYVSSSDAVDKFPLDTKEDVEFEVTFAPLPTEQDSVINYFDVADVRLSNMRTISGDVKYVNIYVLSKGAQSEQGFDLIAQIPLEAEELIFDDSNIKNGRTGFFINQEKINSYWHAYASKGTQLSGSGAPANNIKLEQTGSQIAYGMSISGSVEGENEDIVVQTSQSFDLNKSTPYSLSFKAYAEKLPKGGMTGKRGILECYVSGSNIPKNHNLGNGLGRRILTIDLDSDDYKSYNTPSTDFNLQTLEGVFIPLQKDNAKLQFRVKAGYWHVADISLRPSTETNFNPRNARVFAEMPPSRNRPDKMRFLCEFVNNDGTKADSVTLSSEVEFPGANFAIQGDNNVLSGSMFISNAIGQGIEMAGVGSAFLRTIGWEGFVSASQGQGKGGFLLYSGSVLEDSTDEYEGAGLEIHDGQSGSAERYFQFKTQDGASSESIFRVKTDDFLFGISGSGGVESYISGSDGKLEISSSNFAISNTGDVTMAGVVTATSGKIGDWTISGGDIVGANITMDADSSRIYKTDSNGNLDGFYMDFTPGSNYYVRFGTDFAVSSSGQLIASGAIIEGVLTASEGFIANWTIAPNTIHKRNLGDLLYTGLSSVGDTRFFAGASNLNAGTSSAVFNVKDDGQISGSDVLFTGGQIAGWYISGNVLKSPNSTGGIRLNASGKKITINSHSFAESGMQFDYNSGNPRFYVGDGDNNFIRFDSSPDPLTGVQIKTQYFEVDATNFEVSSTESSMSLGEGKIILDGGTISTIKVGSDADRQINITGSTTIAAIRSGKKSATDTSTAGFWLANNSTDHEFYIGNAADTAHIKFDGGDASLKTGTFELDATSIEISSTQKSMSLGDGAIKLVGAGTSTLTVGSTAGKLINITGSNDRAVINTGKESITDTTAGFWLANINGTPQFNVGDSTSFVKFTGTDMSINSRAFELSASNLEISSTNASMSIGPRANPYILLDGASGVSANESYISVGSHTTRRINISGSATAGVINTGKESVDDSTAGFWLANNNGNVEVNIGSPSGYLKLASGDFTVEVDALNINATDIELSSNQASASFGHDTDVGTLILEGAPARLTIVSGSIANTDFRGGQSGSGTIMRIGDITDNDGGDKYGLMMFDGTGTDVETDRILSLGDRGNVIGGWEITTNQIRAIPDAGVGEVFAEGETKLVIHSAGRIETSDFATGLKGWRIDSLGNGTAEFENMRIRGTLSTTVFEKECVNVVGGQLMVANSTTIKPLMDESGSILAGAASMSAADVTMSCANVSGFASGEIIKTKKVGDTGFTVEYMYVTGSQRYTATGSPYSASIASSNMGAVDPDGLAGELYVGRGYGQTNVISSSIGTLDTALSIVSTGSYGEEANLILDLGSNSVTTQSILKIDSERFKVTSASAAGGSTGNNQTIRAMRDYMATDSAAHAEGATVYSVDTDAEFLFGLVSTAQTYNEGQVIVSTGKFDASKDLSSGYLIMNANPNDISTPYLDIIERTGSGVYDLQLRARVGDLAGLSSGYLYGDEEPGFGIYTDNGFFRGTIQAMTGSIHGILHVATTAGGIETGDRIDIGRNVDGSSDGIRINGSNYWYTTGAWRVGGSTNYLKLDSASGGNIDIAADSFNLNTNTLQVSSSVSTATFRIGPSKGPANVNDTSNAGVFMNQLGYFTFVKDSDEYIKFDGTALEARIKELNLVAGNMTLSGSSSSYIKLGTISSVTDLASTNKGFYVDNSGNVLLKGSTANNDYIQVGSGSAVKIKTTIFDLETTGLDIIGSSGSGASNKVRLGATATNNDAFASNSTGIYMDGGGNFRIGDATSANYFKVSAGGSVTIATDTFELAATDLDISSTSKFIKIGEDQIVLQGGVSSSATSSVTVGSAAGKQMEIGGSATEAYIKSGKRNVEDTTNAGLWLANHAGTPEFFVGDGGSNEFIKFDGSAISMAAETFDLDATNLDISSTGPFISLSEGKIYLDGANNIITVGSSATKQIRIVGGASSGSISFGKTNVDSTTAGFWLANNNTDSEFHLGDSAEYIKFDGGALTIKSADIDITATAFSLNAGSGKLVLESTTPRLSLTDNTAYLQIGSLTDSSTTATTNKGVFMTGGGSVLIKATGTASKDYLMFNSGSGLSIKSANIDVQAGGVNIVGTSATSGSNYIKIGGVSSATDTEDASVGVFIDGDGNFLAKSATTSTGYIKAAGGDVTIKSGVFGLKTSTIQISSSLNSGTITLGATANTGVAGTNAGIYMDGTGDFLIYGDANNYFRFDVSDSLDIKAENFDLATSTMVIDSGTYPYSSSNAGYISLGAYDTKPSAYDSGKGVYLDSTGKALFGDAGGSFINFDGSDLVVNTTNFGIDVSGNVTMAGTVTADAGDIGGFSIGGGKMTAESGGDTMIIQSAASGSQKMQLSDEDGALAVMRFGKLTVSSSLGGTQTFTSADGNPYSSVAGSKGNIFALNSTTTLNATANSGLMEFGPGDDVGTGLTLIAVSGGDVTTAETSYLFRMKIKSTVSASLWSDFVSPHDYHDVHELVGSGRVTYNLNVLNKTTGNVVANVNDFTVWQAADLTDSPTVAAEHLTGGTWRAGAETVTLEGSFTNAVGFTDRLEYQVTCSVGSMDFNVNYVDEEAGGTGTENAWSRVHGQITSFLLQPNTKVTELTPKGIQTVHTTTAGSEKYLIVDHDATGSFTVGVNHSENVWFLHSAGNFRHTGDFYASGDVYAYLASDIRLKENIELVKDPIHKLKQMRGVSFSWNKMRPRPKDFHNPIELGLIAQEVQEVLPEVVREREDGYYAIKYDQIIPVLVEGIKAQQDQIEILEDKVEKLEHKLE